MSPDMPGAGGHNWLTVKGCQGLSVYLSELPSAVSVYQTAVCFEVYSVKVFAPHDTYSQTLAKRWGFPQSKTTPTLAKPPLKESHLLNIDHPKKKPPP